MWMQILRDAGLSVMGDAFPADWSEIFHDANPRGFFESTLVEGINYATNPNPESGARIDPVAHRDVVVKVFLGGVLATERPYLGKVLVSVRHWRAYCASMVRAHEILQRSDPDRKPPRPHLRWWQEHVGLLHDAERRGYDVRFVCYDEVLRAPREQVGAVMTWLNLEADLDAAIAAVEPALKTQAQGEIPGPMPEDWAAPYDRLYDVMVHGDVRAQDAALTELAPFHREVMNAVGPPSTRPDKWPVADPSQ